MSQANRLQTQHQWSIGPSSPRPIENCYWVVPGLLLAGEYPRLRAGTGSQEKVNALLAAGIQAFIDLTEEGELEPYVHLLRNASHARFPVRDMSIPRSFEQTTDALDSIDTHLDAGRPVYVHCWGGVGRTGTIIGCWLARHGRSGPAAVACLRELFSHCAKSAGRLSPETKEQERYVLAWRE